MPFRDSRFISSPLLQYYRSRLNEQAQNLAAVRRALPPFLAEHALHLVTDRNNCLLYTDSAAWASQLRFYKEKIVAAVGTGAEGECGSVQIRIISLASGGKTSDGTPALPSQNSLTLLEQHSESVKDTELQRSLKKLCRTLALKSKR